MRESASQELIESGVNETWTMDGACLKGGGFAMWDIAGKKTSDILKQHKLNFETTYNVARPSFVQMMKQKSGRIFIIGSKPGLSAEHGKGMVAYGLAK